MKLTFGVLAVLLIAVSLVADYKWRQWMAARRRERQQDRNSHGPSQLQ